MEKLGRPMQSRLCYKWNQVDKGVGKRGVQSPLPPHSNWPFYTGSMLHKFIVQKRLCISFLHVLTLNVVFTGV